MEIKDILMWLFIFVVGSLIIQFIVYPESFDSFKENIQSSTESVQQKTKNTFPDSQRESDQLMVQCLESYQNCKYIAENKFGVSIKLIENQKFTDLEPATDFINIWRNPLTMALDPPPKETDLPVVVFATRQEKGGDALPTVFVCNNKGELIQGITKSTLCG